MDEIPAAPDSDDPADHSLVVTDAATYLIYTFFAGRPIDVHSVAHRLMKAGIAETAYSAVMPDVRVAPRYGSLIKTRHEAAAVRDYVSGPATIRSGIAVWREYPRSGSAIFPLMRVIAKARLRLWFETHNPLRKQPDTPLDGVDDSQHESDFVTELAAQMDEVEKNLVESVAQAQAVGAVTVEVETRLLKPGYLITEPYLRLGLRGSKHRFVKHRNAPDPAGTKLDASNGAGEVDSRRNREVGSLGALGPRQDGESEVPWSYVDALAMLHRSGVIQLVLRVPLPEALTGRELVGSVTSKSSFIAASVLPEPLLEPMQMENLDSPLNGHWEEELSEGVRWREIEFESPTRLDDLFALYFTAFQESMPSIGPNWWCYPVIIGNGVGCGCTRAGGMKAHRHDLARLMLQMDKPEQFRGEVIDDLLVDVGNREDTSVLLAEHRGAYIHWGQDRKQNWPDDLYTLVPVEQALLQGGQLWSLEWQFAQAAARPGNLEALEESLISGMEEFRSSQITARDAQALVDRMLTVMDVPGRYSRLMDSVNQLHQKVTAAESRWSATRANLLALLAVLVAVALGLPALRQSIDIAKTVPDDSILSPTARPFVWLGDRGATGLWAAFLVMVMVTLVAWLLGSTWGRRRKLRRRWFPAGRAWDIPLDLRFEEDQE